MSRTHAEEMVLREIGKRTGLGTDYNYDAHTNMAVKLLIRHVEAFERACEIEGINPAQTQRLMETVIFGAVPSHVQTEQLQEVEERFKQHLMNSAPVPGAEPGRHVFITDGDKRFDPIRRERRE